ncbi:zf-HC2 domain-containing protein [Paenibacillus sp. M1]|uniref:Anti-sigma-W factor RsiW n=1 Tax=Paenibacillus haidiansis TaxID=1574488 RepID=A0ABU7VMU8_9BACL
MKCSEAVEWMHRYIDHDLSEEESSLLFEHMRSCKDCSEKFALLTELSAKLEDLPKVTPRFSLVDAIMPQLDEIDRARKEGGSAAEDVPGTMVAVQDENTGASGRVDRSERRMRSRAYRTGALGLAAAVVLGVFIYQYEPREVPNAEIASNTAYDKDNSSTGSSASTDEAANDSPTLFTEQLDGESGSNAQNGANKPAADTETQPESPGNAGGSELKAPANNGEKDDQAVPDRSGDDAVPAEADSKAPAEDRAEPKPAQSGSPNDSVTPPKESEVPDQEALVETGDVVGSFKSTPQSPAEDSMADSRLMGITNFTVALNQWTSPDGTYMAEFKDGYLFVYRNDFEGYTLLTDREIDGSWVKGEWSEDGKTFTYETEKDGKTSTHTVDPLENAKQGEPAETADPAQPEGNSGSNASANQP